MLRGIVLAARAWLNVQCCCGLQGWTACAVNLRSAGAGAAETNTSTKTSTRRRKLREVFVDEYFDKRFDPLLRRRKREASHGIQRSAVRSATASRSRGTTLHMKNMPRGYMQQVCAQKSWPARQGRTSSSTGTTMRGALCRFPTPTPLRSRENTGEYVWAHACMQHRV